MKGGIKLRKTTSISLSEKEQQKAKELMDKYELLSLSELFRVLINEELQRLNHYKDILK